MHKRGRIFTVTRPVGTKRPPPAMLHSLNALAGKISPGGGLDTNANRHTHPNRNHKMSSPSSPYSKPNPPPPSPEYAGQPEHPRSGVE
ncbi:unnamed protein product [Parnassius mnemosyne]|uniref:Uncharacterized protein n=1 Tax=Parnassius mnemosyne TaxID=213953 RepID=A0AAV1LZ34_9NEOP